MIDKSWQLFFSRAIFCACKAQFTNSLIGEHFKYLEVQSDIASLFTAGDAEEIVRNLPEVREWRNKLSMARTAIIAEEERNGFWVVHVCETLQDHTATFNWFYVDANTGEVKKEFD